MSHSLSEVTGIVPDWITIRRALISLSDKTDLTTLARSLVGYGIELISTGGTAKAIQDCGLKVTEISEFTGFPEIFDGRVKTLHPKVHGGLLSVRGNEKHDKQALENNIQPIDLVIMNLYPFQSTVNSGAGFNQCVENIDIGGPSMLRSAAKNHHFVTIVTSPSQYPELLEQLNRGQGSIGLELRRQFAAQAFALSAQYDSSIAAYFKQQVTGGVTAGSPSSSLAPQSDVVTRVYKPEIALKYGINPHQRPSIIYSHLGSALPFAVLSGQPGYINLLDAINSWQLVSEVREALGGIVPVAASFKHCSPAGVALGVPLSREEVALYELGDGDAVMSPIAIAYLRARNCDPMCSYGDFAAISHVVDVTTARLLQTAVCDGLIAPGYDEEALVMLRKKKKGAFIILQADPDFVYGSTEYREVSDVVFSQARNDVLVTAEHMRDIKCADGCTLDSAASSLTTATSVSADTSGTAHNAPPVDLPPTAMHDLILSTITVKYTQSNSVAYAVNGQVVGVGAGQQSRVDCVKLAGRKVVTWHLRHHPKVQQLPFREGVKKQDRVNARVRYIEGDITSAEMPIWLDHFTSAPEPLTEDEKRRFMDQLSGVSIASDGFFPFRDSIDHASKFGVRYIAQPGGSIADDEVIAACNEYRMTMAFTHLRLFHH